jgi:hypothetical protein
MAARVKITDRYDQANLECACIIAGNPEKYQGVLQEWADTILSKAAEPDDAEAGPLFQQPRRQAA